MPTVNLSALDRQIDEESYTWMEDNFPGLLKAIAEAVQKGATPEEIYGHMYRRTERTGISRRCQQAARYLARDK